MGSAAIGLVDTAVLGRTSSAQLAAAGLGASLFFPVAIVGMGLVLGTEPVIAQALGAADPARARRTFRQGVWLALFATPVLVAVIGVILVALPYCGVDPAVVPACRLYLVVRTAGLLPFLLYWSVKAWLQSHRRTTAPVVGVVLAVVLEIGLDLVLVPRYGVAGAGIANAATSTLRLLVVVVAAEL